MLVNIKAYANLTIIVFNKTLQLNNPHNQTSLANCLNVVSVRQLWLRHTLKEERKILMLQKKLPLVDEHLLHPRMHCLCCVNLEIKEACLTSLVLWIPLTAEVYSDCIVYVYISSHLIQLPAEVTYP